MRQSPALEQWRARPGRHLGPLEHLCSTWWSPSWPRGSRRRWTAGRGAVAGAGLLEPARVRSSGRGSRRRWEPSSALLDLVVKLKPPGQQLDAGSRRRGSARAALLNLGGHQAGRGSRRRWVRSEQLCSTWRSPAEAPAHQAHSAGDDDAGVFCDGPPCLSRPPPHPHSLLGPPCGKRRQPRKNFSEFSDR